MRPFLPRLLPASRETTVHGIPNDITVPTLRLRQILIGDEIMILAAMALLLIGWTIIDTWILPIFMLTIAFIVQRERFSGIQTRHDLDIHLWTAVIICAFCFIGGYFIKDAVYIRIEQAFAALWRWPPQVGRFVELIAFIFIPFLVPLLVRIPVMTEFFKVTLMDPTWPSERIARDIEGVQSPYYYADSEQDKQAEVREVKSTVSDGNGHQKSIFLEDTVQMRDLARAILHGADFTESTINRYLGYGRRKWLKFRDGFFDREWAVWKNKKHHQEGILLLKEGRQAFKNLLLPHSDVDMD